MAEYRSRSGMPTPPRSAATPILDGRENGERKPGAKIPPGAQKRLPYTFHVNDFERDLIEQAARAKYLPWTVFVRIAALKLAKSLRLQREEEESWGSLEGLR